MIQRMTQNGSLTGVVSVEMGSLRYRGNRDGGYVTFEAAFQALGPWMDGTERETALSLRVAGDSSTGSVSVSVAAVHLLESYEEEGAYYDADDLDTLPGLRAWARRAVAGLTPRSFNYGDNPAAEMREELADMLDGRG